MRSFLFFYIHILFGGGNAFADVHRVAVLDLYTEEVVEEGFLRSLSEEIRHALVQYVDTSSYVVMTRENILLLIKDQNKDGACFSGSCEVEVARNIGAEYVVSGSVNKVSDTYIVSVKLHSTRDGVFLSGHSIRGTSMLTLLDEISEVTRLLLSDAGISFVEEKASTSEGKTVVENNAPRKENIALNSRAEYASVLIRGGHFTMGCTKGDGDCESVEKPAHRVTIGRDFYMMTSEVTQGLYQSVMGENPSTLYSRDICVHSTCPVESVSWYDAVRMANKLSEREGLEICYEIGSGSNPDVTWSKKDCSGWRLPTEAEWEYAARGGEEFRFAGSDDVTTVGWSMKNSGRRAHSVCTKKVNGYGLCDMSGNLFEWVWDSAFVDDSHSLSGLSKYKAKAQIDPVIQGSGERKMTRGGGWYGGETEPRVSFRTWNYAADDTSYFLGFRLLRGMR